MCVHIYLTPSPAPVPGDAKMGGKGDGGDPWPERELGSIFKKYKIGRVTIL